MVKLRDDPIFSQWSVATDGCDAALSPISQEQFARRRGISLSRPVLPTPQRYGTVTVGDRGGIIVRDTRLHAPLEAV